MRIWSIHPRFLDGKGLVACWRETLLAQAVLAGRTRGYTRHPQLVRFRAQADPPGVIGAYLAAVADEADARGYRFRRDEWRHLQAKLAGRSPEVIERWRDVAPEPHPLFRVVPGPIESWERQPSGARS
jgi:hypothetical protein